VDSTGAAKDAVLGTRVRSRAEHAHRGVQAPARPLEGCRARRHWIALMPQVHRPARRLAAVDAAGRSGRTGGKAAPEALPARAQRRADAHSQAGPARKLAGELAERHGAAGGVYRCGRGGRRARRKCVGQSMRRVLRRMMID